MRAVKQFIKRVRDHYQTRTEQIDDDAIIAIGDDGIWVEAWILIGDLFEQAIKCPECGKAAFLCYNDDLGGLTVDCSNCGTLKNLGFRYKHQEKKPDPSTRSELDSLELVVKVWSGANRGSIDVAHLGPLVGKDPQSLRTYYEGQKAALQMVMSAIEKVRKGEWKF